MMMKTATVLAIALAALVVLPTTATDEIAMGGGWGLSDKWDEETQAAFGVLLNDDIVASGYFAQLRLPGDPSDPYAPTDLVRRFEVLEMFHGPNVESLDLIIDSDLLPVPGGDISVYQARRAYMDRRGTLREQKADAEEMLRSGSATDETLSRYARWRGFLNRESSRQWQTRPDGLQRIILQFPQLDFYAAGPVFGGVKYLVFLGARDDDGRYHFPVSTRWGLYRGFWGEAAEQWEARLRTVLSSDELMEKREGSVRGVPRAIEVGASRRGRALEPQAVASGKQVA